ncbi:shugoshin 1 isoform X1 [Anguilla rostrata]|uniref:shugoshin 1 isoform X1 n=1 Tax=Anguilla rostrata TaxID=7938 RepID=UPI0030D23614
MVRERVQKKSYQQSLEDIKEKMKEKRSKRLQSACATSRGLSKNKSKINMVSSSRPLLLKSVQENNRSLARALEEEKAKLRQAQGLVLQMKREQQALLLHLLLLRRKLHERDQGAGLPKHTQSPPAKQGRVDSGAAPFASSPVRIDPACDQEAFKLDICTEEEPSQPMDEAPLHMAEVLERAALPRTVTARRRPESRRSSAHKRGRRSFCQRNGPALPEPFACEGEEPEEGGAAGGRGAKPAADQQGEPELSLDLEPLPQEFGPAQQSTPEPPPPKAARPRPQQQDQQRKPTASRARPERGRKPDRAPLKRPWENAKPRARSQSRERAKTKPRATPGDRAKATPGDRLNASLGSNDTFDFDCEEAVHLTPFRAGGRPAGEEPGGATPGGGGAGGGASPSSSESSSSQDEDDSLYQPYRKARPNAGGVARAETPPRRARSKRRSILRARLALGPGRDEENASPKPRPTCGSTEAGRLVDLSQSEGIPESNTTAVPRHPKPRRTSVMDKENQPANDGADPLSFGAESEVFLSEADPAPLTPGEEPAVCPADAPLCAFTAPTCLTPATGRKTRPPVTTEKKSRKGTCGLWARSNRRSGPCDVTNVSYAAFRKFSAGRSHGGSASASTGADSAPGPPRKRRSTIAVDYKEPTLSAKLRRGDRFTDTQFLRSPIFKQKRRSAKSARTPLSKYNESFVGCL